MSLPYSFTISSTLRATPEQVWAHAGSFDGVNRELWPLCCMTHPRHLRMLAPETFPVGRTAFRAWIHLFGLVPIEFDDFRLIELEPGQGFLEASRLLSIVEWRHRRTLTATGNGCVLTDDIAFVPRWRATGPLLAGTYRFAFAWRQRCLRRLFA